MLKRVVSSSIAIALLASFSVSSSTQAKNPDTRGALEVKSLMTELTVRVSRDHISPTKASRLYAYVASAMFLASTSPDDALRKQMNAAPSVPQADSSINPVIAALAAGSSVARNLFPVPAAKTTFGERRDQVLQSVSRDLPAKDVAASIAFGIAVSDAVVARAKTDGFEEAKTMMPPDTKGPGIWTPTPPGFQPAIDPGWGTLKMFFAHSGDCTLPAPPTSGAALSPFQGAADEVATVAKSLTEEQKDIARFWDDSRGRTGTPSGHWLVIALNAAIDHQSTALEAIRIVAHTMMSIADAFIVGWKLKYQYMVERPVTVLERSDPTWTSYLTTPAFPEYPSGHSTISRAAADTLTSYFGVWKFTDPGYGMTEESLGSFDVLPRTFASFDAAAKEASISRLYGGIHYSIGLNSGVTLGACIASKTL
ncbi:MAG: vanadium-dependent haloperoxidase [Actinomycetes bacterium]